MVYHRPKKCIDCLERKEENMAITTTASGANGGMMSEYSQPDLPALLQVVDESKILEIDAKVQAELYIESGLRQVYRQQEQQASAARAIELNRLVRNLTPESIFALVQQIQTEKGI
jgi:hypothetical protein